MFDNVKECLFRHSKQLDPPRPIILHHEEIYKPHCRPRLDPPAQVRITREQIQRHPVIVKSDIAQGNLGGGHGIVQILDKRYGHLVVHLVVRTRANKVLH
jgi:hypothetical protein